MSVPAVHEVLLIRHAETDWNRARRLQGWVDTSLNGRGRRQARALAIWCRNGWKFGAQVVCSPLARARQTAAPIARAGGFPVAVDNSLIEIDHGAWAGLTISLIARRFPAAIVDGQLRPEAFECGRGESLGAAHSRASKALCRLLAISAASQPLTRILVVGHGVTNALLMCAAVGQAPDRVVEYAGPNGCAHLLRFRRRALSDLTCQSLIAPGVFDEAERRRSHTGCRSGRQ